MSNETIKQNFGTVMEEFRKNMGFKKVTDTINGQTFTGEAMIRESTSTYYNENGDIEVIYQQLGNEKMKIECFYDEDKKIIKKNISREDHVAKEQGKEEYHTVATEEFEYDENNRLIKVTTVPDKYVYTLYTYFDSPTEIMSLRIDKRDGDRVLSKCYDKKMRLISEALYSVTDKDDLIDPNNLIKSTITSFHGRYRKVQVYEPATKSKSITHYRSTDNAVIFEYFKEPGKPVKERRAWYKDIDMKVIRGFKEFVGKEMISKTDFILDNQDRIVAYDLPNNGGRAEFKYIDDVEKPYTIHTIKDAKSNLVELGHYTEDCSIMETLLIEEGKEIYYYKTDKNDILYVVCDSGDLNWGFNNGKIKAVYASGTLDVTYKEGNVEHNRKYALLLPSENDLYNYLYGIFKELNPFEIYKSYLTGNLFKNGFTTED